MSDENNPSIKSGDFQAMEEYLETVDAFLAGLKGVRAAGSKLLPKMPAESDDKHTYRLNTSRLTNVWRDIVENLSQRPFAKTVALSDETTPDLKDFSEDVDGCGTNLHSFAKDCFFDAVARGMDLIIIDYPSSPGENLTRDQEAKLGLRPYWVRYSFSDIIDMRSARVGGREELVHLRLAEKVEVQDGFKTTVIEQVRMFERPMEGNGVYGNPFVRIYQKDDDKKWVQIGEDSVLSLPYIPAVPLITGRRVKAKSWRIAPPMRDALDLQVELYQQESGKKFATDMTAFPMLAGNGVQPDLDDSDSPKPINTAPGAVLYAPPGMDGNHGEWQWLEPSGESLKFLASEVKETILQLRELGRQPLTAQSGNMTTITASVAASKGNAAIQNWVINLKSTLDLCMKITADWLNVDAAKSNVMIPLDFDLSFGDLSSFEHVHKMREEGEISREAYVTEAKRRNILEPDYDPEVDGEKILGEIEGDDDEDSAET